MEKVKEIIWFQVRVSVFLYRCCQLFWSLVKQFGLGVKFLWKVREKDCVTWLPALTYFSGDSVEVYNQTKEYSVLLDKVRKKYTEKLCKR